MSDNWRPFIIRRTSGGDLLRSDTPWFASLRFGPLEVDYEAVKATTITTRPLGYTGAMVSFSIPGTINWEKIVVVRGGFGFPMTPQDGVVVHYFDGPYVAGQQWNNRFVDTPLTTGRWYYYTVFLWIGGQWVIAQTGDVVVPGNFGSGQHLFDLLPPFYQKVDDEQAGNAQGGPLRRFLAVFGYDLDYVRTYIEGVMNVWSADDAPLVFTQRSGFNMGFGIERILGGARYRSLVQQLVDLNDQRGTSLGLQGLVMALSNYPCVVSLGENKMLSADDSEFEKGAGHWATLADAGSLANITDPAFTANHPTAQTLSVIKYPGTTLVPPVGRGILQIQAASGTVPQACISCGLSGPDIATVPYYQGVPVVPGTLYELQFQCCHVGGVDLRVIGSMLWYDKDGAFLETTNGPVNDANPVVTNDSTTWTRISTQANAPDGAYYTIPAIWWYDDAGAVTDIAQRFVAGVQVAPIVGAGGNIVPVSPDLFLTLGVPSKTLASPQSILGEGQ